MMFFDERINRKTFHQPVKLFRCKLSGLRRITRPGEVTIFHTLGKEKEEESASLSMTESRDDTAEHLVRG